MAQCGLFEGSSLQPRPFYKCSNLLNKSASVIATSGASFVLIHDSSRAPILLRSQEQDQSIRPWSTSPSVANKQSGSQCGQ